MDFNEDEEETKTTIIDKSINNYMKKKPVKIVDEHIRKIAFDSFCKLNNKEVMVEVKELIELLTNNYSFYEYFVAKHVVEYISNDDKKFKEWINENKFDRRYENVFIFIAGLIDIQVNSQKLNYFFETIMGEPVDEYGYFHVITVCKCFSELNNFVISETLERQFLDILKRNLHNKILLLKVVEALGYIINTPALADGIRNFVFSKSENDYPKVFFRIGQIIYKQLKHQSLWKDMWETVKESLTISVNIIKNNANPDELLGDNQLHNLYRRVCSSYTASLIDPSFGFRDDMNPCKAILILGGADPEIALNCLFSHKNELVRYYAALSLSYSKIDSHIEILLTNIITNHDIIRSYRSAVVLGLMGYKQAIQPIIDLLKDTQDTRDIKIIFRDLIYSKESILTIRHEKSYENIINDLSKFKDNPVISFIIQALNEINNNEELLNKTYNELCNKISEDKFILQQCISDDITKFVNTIRYVARGRITEALSYFFNEKIILTKEEIDKILEAIRYYANNTFQNKTTINYFNELKNNLYS